MEREGWRSLVVKMRMSWIRWSSLRVVDSIGVPAMLPPPHNFYRRPLPTETCIDFSGEEGVRLFTEALAEGNASIFFKLIAQFRTQDDPAYCGLSSLVMVLNALDVDPGQVWRAPWRFYHESMLDCCVPLESVKKSGLTLPQVACLATCNRLHCQLVHSENTSESVALLRSDIISSVRSKNRVLLASYDRSVLRQTGSGHFSPVAAFHSASDSVLLLDVARFKYPPHWVSLPLLHSAMCSVDPSTNKSRGYLNLSLKRTTRPLLVFRVRANICNSEPQFASSLSAWQSFLSSPLRDDDTAEFEECCRRFSQHFSSFAICCASGQQGCNSCNPESKDLKESQESACRELCRELRESSPARVLLSSAVAALLFAWPFTEEFSVRSERLRKRLMEERKSFSAETENEISLLSTQLSIIVTCCSNSPLPPREIS